MPAPEGDKQWTGVQHGWRRSNPGKHQTVLAKGEKFWRSPRQQASTFCSSTTPGFCWTLYRWSKSNLICISCALNLHSEITPTTSPQLPRTPWGWKVDNIHCWDICWLLAQQRTRFQIQLSEITWKKGGGHYFVGGQNEPGHSWSKQCVTLGTRLIVWLNSSPASPSLHRVLSDPKVLKCYPHTSKPWKSWTTLPLPLGCLQLGGGSQGWQTSAGRACRATLSSKSWSLIRHGGKTQLNPGRSMLGADTASLPVDLC